MARVSIRQIHTRPLAYWAVLVGVPLAVSLAVIRLVPFSRPIPSYWHDARELAFSGRMTQRFLPAGYAALMSLGMKMSPGHLVAGFELESALIHLLTVLLAWSAARWLGATAAGALVCGVLVAVHPELLVTVAKVWDVGVSTGTLLLVVVATLAVLQMGVVWWRLAALGVALAWACFDRPNDAVLLLPAIFVVWHGRPVAGSLGRPVTQTILLLLTAAAGFILLSATVYGTLVIPQNGPYNLYAGQNDFSEQALLQDLNAEPSMPPSLQSQGLSAVAATAHDRIWQPLYTHAAVSFATHHPWQEIRLVVFKLYTLLRADTKLHRPGTPDGDMKLLLALPVPVWLLTVVWLRSRSGMPWTPPDTCIAAFALAYVVPFLLTNADPRFRTPLDALLLAHTAALLTRGRKAQAVQ